MMLISEEKPYPVRCKLYNLEPIGVGTRYVESLASYISRVAYIHSVSFTRMLRELSQKEITPTPTYINGDSLSTEQLVKRIEEENYRSDIKNLTLLSLEKVVSYTIYKVRAWCPVCYQEFLDNNLIYDPLLWSIYRIRICTKHMTYLETKCPNCLKEQIYKQYYRPGFCSYCGIWLGSNVTKKPRGIDYLTAVDELLLKKMDGYPLELLNEMWRENYEIAYRSIDVFPKISYLSKSRACRKIVHNTFSPHDRWRWEVGK